MSIAADTNLLVRLLIADDLAQSERVRVEFERADDIMLPLSALCELCWVLTSRYQLPSDDIAEALRQLMAQPKIVSERAAVEAGLAMLEAGGDFADGVIAHEGMRLGASEFVSFDKRAVDLLRRRGLAARFPA